MIIESILNGCIAGTGPLGQTAIFPCGIFKCDKDINLYKGTPNYKLFKLAIKSTSKRFYPNYANNNWSVNNAAIKYDIDLKNRVLADIKENHRDYFDKLVNVFKANIDLMHELRLEMIVTEGCVNDYTIVSDGKIYPDCETSTMGCRTYNGYDINYEEVFRRNLDCVVGANGLTINDIEPYYSAAQKDGRGNICPETIILPTLAMEAKENFISEYDDNIIEVFMSLLDQKIHEAKDMLIERFEYICSQSPASAKFMWENNTMSGYVPDEGIRSALKHGTLALGQLGLA